MEKKIYLFLGNVIYRLLLSNFACTPSNEHASLICMRSFKRIILNKPSDFCPVTIRVLVLVFKLIRSRSFEKPTPNRTNVINLYTQIYINLVNFSQIYLEVPCSMTFGYFLHHPPIFYLEKTVDLVELRISDLELRSGLTSKKIFLGYVER